jgi:hypothetical protein
MLEAFAGPPAPLPQRTRHRRHASRRTLVVCAIVLLALAAVPVGWALLSSVWETPKQFLNDPSQSARAKQFIRRELQFERGRMPRFPPEAVRLRAISHLMDARPPEGKVQMYALRFSDGTKGNLVLGAGFRPGVPFSVLVTGVDYGLAGGARRCPSGWALQYVIGGGGTSLPRFRSSGYIVGRAAAKVASIHVLYPDGSRIPGAVANGYFFVWIKPDASLTNVTLVADNRAGETVGRLLVGGYGGSPFPMTGKHWPGFACLR